MLLLFCHSGIFNYLDGGLFAGFAAAGIFGTARAYPELDAWISSRINADGTAARTKLSQRGFCLGNVSLGFPFASVSGWVGGKQALQEPIPMKYLDLGSLLKGTSPTPVAVPRYPRLLLHALEDEIVPYLNAAQYVTEQCAAGADIAFVTFPIAEHLSAQVFSLPFALDFLKKVLDGKAPKTICGTPLPDLFGIFSPKADQVLDPASVAQLRNLNGTRTPIGTTYDLPASI